ncbi:aspartate 1-decarboxylase [Rhizobium lentis]|uniref:aspartate 1-decarboxylase n=1 Tax=Rhizobium TaxID=379 RepID=UPI001C8398E0|nr:MULTISPECIES: aspartate 1-decarboxylase [Rhizobium]MBX5132407.1 aspartate 1-decarboxylase [Rhizobium lentis]MBX5177393.1 aspartate 1-decarboxylase [Rhizobium lentis]MBX5213695.1 aspartate 1-decarboxylase [Rhizobium sp. NLR9a]MBX5219151.1 aspartate 1-decarboxylase [Rhizobium sp. NLR8a]MBX5275085.1 aspartate 1-decarboxylase [Rhizobium sp. NLR13a]
MEKYVSAKLHGIRVTDAKLDYHGSITIDADFCRAVGLKPLEYVDIWNKMSGARISTYVLYGDAGSKCCILNGAAARTCQQNDEIIIASSIFCEVDDIISLKPRVLVFGPRNEIIDRITYAVFRRPDGSLDMAVKTEIADNDYGFPAALTAQSSAISKGYLHD